MRRLRWLLMLGLAVVVSTVQAAELYTSQDMNDLRDRTVLEASRVGADKVLVVYDMDNTLLAMDQDLGSDQWFDWQSSILAQPVPERVAGDMAGLLSVQWKLFALSAMHLTRPEVPAVVDQLKQLGVRQLVLSSRGPENREASMRELKRNHLAFDDSSAGVVKTYLPYNLASPEKDCLSAADVAQLKLGNPRLVSFGDGVMLTSGQHKGAMLRSLLCPTGSRYEVILFIDDKVKNTDAMLAAYTAPAPNLVAYRYASEDARVQAFHSGDKHQAIADWSALKGVIDGVFGGH